MNTLSTLSPRTLPRPRIGLALSSGGARGLAHVGVIQVLEENNIPVDVIAGASMGAYVGSLWAAGHDGAALHKFAAEIASPKDLWRKRLTIPHRVSQAGLWEMWQRWGYECDESYATARGGAA